MSIGETPAAGRGQNEKSHTDQDLAASFLDEMEGNDAFKDYPENVQADAYKVMTLIYFAELSRASIAPLTAAATFHAIANSRKDLGLPESFETGSGEVRPLFTDKGGAALMRDKKPEEMTEEEKKHAGRALADIGGYHKAKGNKDETLEAFAQRKTEEIVEALSTVAHSEHKDEEPKS